MHNFIIDGLLLIFEFYLSFFCLIVVGFNSLREVFNLGHTFFLEISYFQRQAVRWDSIFVLIIQGFHPGICVIFGEEVVLTQVVQLRVDLPGSLRVERKMLIFEIVIIWE